MTTQTIKVTPLLARDLALRSNAEKLFKSVNKQERREVTIDFSSVATITRSFAHEYLLQKKNTTKKIVEKNVPENVAKMFAVIQDNRKQMIVDISQLKPILVSE